MSKISKSPDRHTFQKEGYIKRCEEKGEEPNPNYIAMYKTWREQDDENLVDPEWQKDNLEYDLRSTEWICNKAKASDNYSQNIYAALSNQEWMKLSVVPILTNKHWGCSWRHAGGIVADMREQGDYINWYCSGIGSNENGYGLDSTVPELEEDGRTYVPEGTVTDEIREDFKKMGWIPVDSDEKY